MTPQERWWALRDRLPKLTRWQKIGAIAGSILVIALLVIFILPFLFPLRGEIVAAESLADPNGAFIDIQGTQIYYVHDPAPGEAVILIHGFGGATIHWRNVMPALQAAGYDVYALDLPGFGLSEKGLAIDMSHPAQAEMIAAFMEAQGIASAHLVGHSMGANIILHLAQRYPAKVKSLTLTDAAIETATTAQLPAGLFENRFVKRWTQVLLRWMIPDTIEIQLKSAVENDGVVTPEMVEDHLRTLKTQDWELSWLALARDSYLNALPEPLNTLEMPILILWGAEDSWIAPENGQWLHADLPGSILITFPGVGHLPMYEDPDTFNYMLIDFLADS